MYEATAFPAILKPEVALIMEFANLNEHEKQKLSKFERELGVVLVAYQEGQNDLEPDSPSTQSASAEDTH